MRRIVLARCSALAAFATISASTIPVQAAMCVVGVERGDRLNIRNGPGVRNRAIGRIPSRACGVTIVGRCHGDWCPVRWRGQRGWVHGDFLGRYDRPPTRAERGLTATEEERPPQRQSTLQPTPPEPKFRQESPADQVSVPQSEKVQVTNKPASAATPQPTQPIREPQRSTSPLPRAAIAIPQPPVKSSTKPMQKSASAASSVYCVKGVAAGDTLKVRSGPGPDFILRYGYLPNTCGVKITGKCENGWCPVEYRTYKGWAQKQFLRP